MSPEDFQKLQTHVPAVLAATGIGLQWLRQFSLFKDRHYGVLVVAMAAGAYLLCFPIHPPYRLYVVEMIDWMSLGGGITAILGGTFIMSSVAKKIVDANPDAAKSAGVPLTNSK